MVGLLTLVVIAFIVTGIGNPFGSSGAATGTVAKVGDERIGERELTDLFRRLVDQARAQSPTITQQAAARQGGVEQALRQLVSAKALEAYGDEIGLIVGPRSVDREIASAPAFQLGGRFDQATYEQVLAQQRISETELRESLRGDLIRRQLAVPLAVSAPAAAALVDPYVGLLLEKRGADVGIVPSDAAKITPPDDAAISKFYEDNHPRYTIPERRAFRYAMMNQEALEAEVTVSDEEIEQRYKQESARYAGAERRDLLQAVVPDKAEAERIADAVEAGADFAAAAAKVASLGRDDLALGKLSRQEFQSATNVAIAQAAFALPEGGVTEPMQSDFGWNVVKVDGISRTAATSLSSAKTGIASELRKEKSEDQLGRLVAKVEDELAEGENFADIVQAHGLSSTNVAAVTKSGSTGKSEAEPLDPRSRSLLPQVFAMEDGQEPEVQDLEGGRFAVIDLVSVIPPKLQPLKDVRAQVVADLTAKIKSDRAAEIAGEIVKEVQGGSTLAAALSKRGLPPVEQVNERRIDLAGNQQPSPPAALMFRMQKGETRSLSAGGRGTLVLHLRSIEPASPDSEPQLQQAVRRQVGEAAGAELFESFVAAAERAVGVEQYPEQVTAVRERLAGGAP